VKTAETGNFGIMLYCTTSKIDFFVLQTYIQELPDGQAPGFHAISYM